MRIAVGGIAVECCTFSPLSTRLEDFTFWRADELLKLYGFLAEYDDVSFIPLVRARAAPGGPVEPAAYHEIKKEFIAGLVAAGKVDGVYLDLHGAMTVIGIEDAEGDWVAAVREVAGPGCLIAASYDLHGNVSSRVISHIDILTAHRTAPHVDEELTRSRAVGLLVECLRTAVKPHLAFARIPVLLPGEMAMTDTNPARELYGGLPEAISRHALLDASYLVGYAWADEPRVGASAVAVGRDARSARLAARELAAEWWKRRAEFAFGMTTGTVDECIQWAQQSAKREPPVFLSDAGDNITGGGVGDVPVVLQRMLAAGLTDAVYAALVDSDAVAACHAAGPGHKVALSLGGRLDMVNGEPLAVTGTVVTLTSQTPDNRQAVIDVHGVRLVLTERRTAFTTLAQFLELGIDPRACAIVAVKLGYLFPELRAIARAAYLAMSPGVINPVVTALPYRRLARPIYPLDPHFNWKP